jgi:ADP-ribose pyrophosphatase YjhB (NUDIX family)
MQNIVLVSGAIVFKQEKGGSRWLVTKQGEEEGWEIPKVVVRKGESSVRAALRMMGEKGGMTTQILEEAGRAGGVATINGKTLPQRHLYYLMVLRAPSGEAIGFAEHKWLEYAKAVRKLSSKREQMMLRQAKKEYRIWKKKEEAEMKLNKLGKELGKKLGKG